MNDIMAQPMFSGLSQVNKIQPKANNNNTTVQFGLGAALYGTGNFLSFSSNKSADGSKAASKLDLNA